MIISLYSTIVLELYFVRSLHNDLEGPQKSWTHIISTMTTVVDN